MNWTLATNFLIAMLAISNPLARVPLWVEASEHDARRVRWRLALLITGTGSAILFVFLVLREQILSLFGIDLASFRIGGGIVLLLIGLDMLRGKAVRVERHDLDEDQPAFLLSKTRFRQIVVPLVMPMIAGPCAISTVVIYGSRASLVGDYALLSVVLIGMMAAVLATLLGSHRIRRLVGGLALNLLTRTLGLLLVAIAVQFMLEGFGEVFPQWFPPESALSDELRRGE